MKDKILWRTYYLIPHLHFYGNFREAIALYERAFRTECENLIGSRTYATEINPDNKRGEAETPDDKVAHAIMKIHGHTIYLNDRFGNKGMTTDCAVKIIIMFSSADELLECYKIIGSNSITVDPMEKLPYSELAVEFIDKFGVQWGFMVEE